MAGMTLYLWENMFLVPIGKTKKQVAFSEGVGTWGSWRTPPALVHRCSSSWGVLCLSAPPLKTGSLCESSDRGTGGRWGAGGGPQRPSGRVAAGSRSPASLLGLASAIDKRDFVFSFPSHLLSFWWDYPKPVVLSVSPFNLGTVSTRMPKSFLIPLPLSWTLATQLNINFCCGESDFWRKHVLTGKNGDRKVGCIDVSDSEEPSGSGFGDFEMRREQ